MKQRILYNLLDAGVILLLIAHIIWMFIELPFIFVYETFRFVRRKDF